MFCPALLIAIDNINTVCEIGLYKNSVFTKQSLIIDTNVISKLDTKIMFNNVFKLL